MIIFGQVALFVAVLTALWGTIAGALSGITGSNGLHQSSRRAVYATGALVTIVLAITEWALTHDYFGLRLVAHVLRRRMLVK